MAHRKASVERRFTLEAPRRWADYCRLATKLEGESRFRHIDRLTDPGKLLDESRSSFLMAGTNAFIWYTGGIVPPIRATRAEATNARYAFRLKSVGHDRWEVEGLRWHAPDGRLGETFQDIVGDGPFGAGYGGAYDLTGRDTLCSALVRACHGMKLWGTWFPYIVSSKDFVLLQAEPIGETGLVRIRYDYEPAATDGNNVVRGGEVLLDPGRYWLIRRAEFEASFVGSPVRANVTIDNDYADHPAGYPLLVKHVMRVSGFNEDGSHVEHDWVWDYDIREAHPEEHTFQLSAFGLPEPVEPA